MSDTHDDPSLCPDCGGLIVTHWSRLTNVANVELDGRSVPVETLWIAPVPGPCDHPNSP